MDAVEIVAIMGEVFSWIGLLAGLPLLVIGLIAGSVGGRAEATEIVIVQEERGAVARWFAGGDLHQRPLSPAERERTRGEESRVAFVSGRDPSRMRLERRRPLIAACTVVGSVLLITGLIGFVASMLPLFLSSGG